MTLGGALSDLNNLLKADDIPVYYKPSIKAVMETIALSIDEESHKWIPLETELPEVGSEVLVCYEFKKKRYVYIATFYGDGEFHGYDDEYLTTEGRKYRKAVAWMNLPKPPKLSEIPICSGRSDKE